MLMISLAGFIVVMDKTGPILPAKEESIFELVPAPGNGLVKAPNNHFANVPIQRLLFPEYQLTLHVTSL